MNKTRTPRSTYDNITSAYKKIGYGIFKQLAIHYLLMNKTKRFYYMSVFSESGYYFF